MYVRDALLSIMHQLGGPTLTILLCESIKPNIIKPNIYFLFYFIFVFVLKRAQAQYLTRKENKKRKMKYLLQWKMGPGPN